MGISEEIEDAKITTEKTKILRLKRRSEIDYMSKVINTTENARITTEF